ncbi:MAG: V4R domain-containing protein [Nitrososphaerales archaeon]
MLDPSDPRKRIEKDSFRKGPPDTEDYLNSFFQFDPTTNKANDMVFNCRAILTNEEFWSTMQEGLFSLFKSGAAVILYQMGLEFGFTVGSRARELKQNIDEAVKFLEIYGLLAGWGKLKASAIKLSMGHLTEDLKVTLEDNFFATPNGKKAEEPRCFMIAGILAGIIEGLLGEGYNCVETMCMAAGGKHCEFVITRRARHSKES